MELRKKGLILMTNFIKLKYILKTTFGWFFVTHFGVYLTQAGAF